MAFVRSSKFRHVFGTASKQDQCYTNISITKGPFESNMCDINCKFIAVVLESQGGGAFLVLPIDKVGRLELNQPKVSGHKSPVMDVQWNPFDDNVIASCSEDSTVKVWKIPDGGLTEHITEPIAELKGHQRKCYHVQWHPTAKDILASSAADHVIIIWNVDTEDEVFRVTGHPDQIYSYSWNYDGSLIATTCKDKTIRVINPRTGEVISQGKGHQGTKPSRVVFCGSMNLLFTTGFSRTADRQYGLWKPDDLSAHMAFSNIDTGSGVLFPFWDNATNMVYLVGKGDTTIKYFEVVPNSPYVHFLSMFQSNVPQRGAGVLPKRHVRYMDCEIMRFYKLSNKGQVDPISMTVPRKSDLFQDDLFPPANAGESSMSAKEWCDGITKDPVTVSFTANGIVRGDMPAAKKDPQPKAKAAEKKPEAPLTATQQKVKAFETRSSSTEPKEPRGKRGSSSSVSPPPVTPEPSGSAQSKSDSEYKKAYEELLAENEALKTQVKELEKKVASMERRATYKRPAAN